MMKMVNLKSGDKNRRLCPQLSR